MFCYAVITGKGNKKAALLKSGFIEDHIYLLWNYAVAFGSRSASGTVYCIHAYIKRHVGWHIGKMGFPVRINPYINSICTCGNNHRIPL